MLSRPRGFDTAQWEVEGSGKLCRVHRPRRGNSAEYEYAKDRAGSLLQLTEADARALVVMLNDMLREARDQAGARRSARSRAAA